jgi:hypothetical protein
MRIRSTKPEFWRSKTIAALDWDVRFVLKGLEAYVDDNGVGKDDIALIASDVFPRDLSARTSETLARLSEAISTLSEAGLIASTSSTAKIWSTSTSGKTFNALTNRDRGVSPGQTVQLNITSPSIARAYRILAENFRKGSACNQRNRGTGEQGNRTPLPPKSTNRRHPCDSRPERTTGG